MKPGLGWMHIKDYRHPAARQARSARRRRDAQALRAGRPGRQRPRDDLQGDCASMLPKLDAKLRRRGIPGVFLDLEPHVKAGGQYGGFSGPDGMGVALRIALPRAGLRPDRLSPARLRRHRGGARILARRRLLLLGRDFGLGLFSQSRDLGFNFRQRGPQSPDAATTAAHERENFVGRPDAGGHPVNADHQDHGVRQCA